MQYQIASREACKKTNRMTDSYPESEYLLNPSQTFAEVISLQW